MSYYWRANPAQNFGGQLTIAGDKSISHRAVMLGALAEGQTEISGFLEGEDCLATVRAFQQLGVTIERHGPGELTVHGRGLHGLRAPAGPLDLGNSGTGMRLMMGILAGQNFDSVLIGDESLSRRPMRRVSKPLIEMGAHIETSENGTAPVKIYGRPLQAINYKLPIASAQMKTALLLAGLYANGTTAIEEIAPTRDHTERMLRGFGVDLEQEGNVLRLRGGQSLKATTIRVPGDISSAAFFIVAGLLSREGELRLENIGINPSRAAFIDILHMMGGHIEIFNRREVSGEPVADLLVKPSKLRGVEVPEHYVSIAIDEFPILFIAAACADGITVARNLGELRVKESDRLATMASNLIGLGISVNLLQGDSIKIVGKPTETPFCSDSVACVGDHRIAMSFAVASLRASGPIRIHECENVATSFPDFFALANAGGLSLEKVDD